MPTTYIQHLATDLLRRFGTDLSHVAVVFPNKRASLFLNEELARQNQRLSSSPAPIWSPAYITISDLFRRHSDLHVADQILLVCRLYDVFCRITGYTNETLDQFYNWGILLLADFDDLDKNMADAEKVFQIVRDLHELDTVDYLSDEQRTALKHFFSNFTDSHESLMQKKFMHLWSKLNLIYTTFREELRNDGLAYEGMLYRDVAEQKELSFEYDTYCFVGFNMLQQVEQNIFTRLKLMSPVRPDAQPRVLFYWDYDTYYLNDKHEAGHFIGTYLSRFPNALDHISHTNFLQHPSPLTTNPSPLTTNPSPLTTNLCTNHVSGQSTTQPPSPITYISAPTENLQARYVHDWLLHNDRWKAGARTAIVMSDERLLQTIIRSLPPEVTKVNITTGYPLSQSPLVSFIHHLIEMQTDGRILGTDKYRLRYVSAVLCHPYATYITAEVTNLYKTLIDSKHFFPTRSQLTHDDSDLTLLFTDLDTITLTGYDTISPNIRLILWLQNIVKHIALNGGLDALARESNYRIYQVLQRLFSLSIDGTLAVDTTTLRRLFMQIVNATTVPYHGEPIEGIQIMGVLETRCLDFDHILLLSCNEGNLPKGVNDSSFIPHSVRRAYGLTTVENKVGIFSYYFHRLLQRCSDITITYNSSTEGTNTGEMSRFMLQLMVEANSYSNLDINRISLQAGQSTTSFFPCDIVKSEGIQARLSEMLSHSISPSSLGKYLRCQVMYYYMYVAQLQDNALSDPDDMSNIVFGIVFHKAAELIYDELTGVNDIPYEDERRDSLRTVVHAEDIRRFLKDPRKLTDCIDKAFALEVFNNANIDSSLYNGLQLINRRVIQRLLRDLLEYDATHTPLRILGLEKKAYSKIKVTVNGVEREITIGGSIDRLDEVTEADGTRRIRVVDYKTGSNMHEALPTVKDVFASEKIKKHTDYFLQAMLYSHNVRHTRWANPDNLPVTPELFFVQKMRQAKFTPYLQFGKTSLMDIAEVDDDYISGLSSLIAEIHNPDIPFRHTTDADTCTLCPFKTLCGM